jgi:hypothetical protein
MKCQIFWSNLVKFGLTKNLKSRAASDPPRVGGSIPPLTIPLIVITYALMRRIPIADPVATHSIFGASAEVRHAVFSHSGKRATSIAQARERFLEQWTRSVAAGF